jgi:hypothetical protein
MRFNFSTGYSNVTRISVNWIDADNNNVQDFLALGDTNSLLQVNDTTTGSVALYTVNDISVDFLSGFVFEVSYVTSSGGPLIGAEEVILYVFPAGAPGAPGPQGPSGPGSGLPTVNNLTDLRNLVSPTRVSLSAYLVLSVGTGLGSGIYVYNSADTRAELSPVIIEPTDLIGAYSLIS